MKSIMLDTWTFINIMLPTINIILCYQIYVRSKSVQFSIFHTFVRISNGIKRKPSFMEFTLEFWKYSQASNNFKKNSIAVGVSYVICKCSISLSVYTNKFHDIIFIVKKHQFKNNFFFFSLNWIKESNPNLEIIYFFSISKVNFCS